VIALHPGRHPFPELIVEKIGPEKRDEKDEKEGQYRQDILPHTTGQHGPVGIAGVMERDPEERPERDGEEIIERQEIRIGELLAIHDAADDAKDEPKKREPREDRAERKLSGPEALGRRDVDGMGMAAHWFWLR
jgi:hypothetical protein